MKIKKQSYKQSWYYLKSGKVIVYCPVLIVYIYVRDGKANGTEIFSCWLHPQLSFPWNILIYCLIDSFSFLPWNRKTVVLYIKLSERSVHCICLFRSCWALCKYNQQSWNHREAAGDVLSDLCRGFVVFRDERKKMTVIFYHTSQCLEHSWVIQPHLLDGILPWNV